MQHKQQETLVHIISVLNVTRYATQVNKQHINLIIWCSRKDTSGCHHALQHHQFTLHQPQLPTNCTSHPLHSGKPQRFTILCETSHHACNGLHRCSHNWYTITSCTPSKDLWKMLIHTEEALPSTMHLPVSSEDTLHFYRYLHTHIFITDKQITDKQWIFQNNSSVHVKRLMDCFAVLTHLFNHLPIHHPVLQLYTQRTRLELRKDAHYRLGKPIV